MWRDITGRKKGHNHCYYEVLRPSLDVAGLSNGAGTRIRTGDLLITNQLLYQLSYAGEGRGF